ncbi:MAG: hypothetical protein M1269_12780 [Chloroflexi bacterium]|nr:hypothetical protein [Chloroflexota bacterium]
MQVPPPFDSKFHLFKPQSIQFQTELQRNNEIEVVVLDALQPGKRVVRIEIPRNKEREVVKIIENALNIKADIRYTDF